MLLRLINSMCIAPLFTHGKSSIKTLLFVSFLSAAALSGCASTPQEGHFLPASDHNSTPDTPIKDVKGKHRYALSLMQKGDWHDAAETLELITQQRPRLPGPWVNLGIVKVKLGDSHSAEQAFKHALDASADSIEAYNQLGMLYRRTGRLHDARLIYNEGLKQDPDHADLHWNLAILHDRYLPDHALALAHYQRYQQLTKSDDAQLQHWITQLQKEVPANEPVRVAAEAKK